MIIAIFIISILGWLLSAGTKTGYGTIAVLALWSISIPWAIVLLVLVAVGFARTLYNQGLED